MQRLACAPNVAPNEAARAMCSDTMSEEILSSSTPPYCSGTLMPSSPSSPHRRTIERARSQFFSSSASSCGNTSFSTNSSVVCAIRRCSSDNRSGVNTAEGSVSSSNQEPPRAAVGVVIVLIGSPLHAFEYSGRSLSAADAHRHQAVARLAPLHLVQERRRQLGAGAAQRMTQRNRAAVDVQFLRIDRQLAETREHLRRESLVPLDPVDLVERQDGELVVL